MPTPNAIKISVDKLMERFSGDRGSMVVSMRLADNDVRGHYLRLNLLYVPLMPPIPIAVPAQQLESDLQHTACSKYYGREF